MEKKKKKKGFGLGCRASVHDAFAKRRLGLRLTEIVVSLRLSFTKDSRVGCLSLFFWVGIEIDCDCL